MSVDYSKIKKVITIYDVRQVNKCLSEGWVILSIASGQDESKYPLNQYSLGHVNELAEVPH
ncbi:hypothetical protein OZZ14_09490 [Acinetobacter baumannii]|uniref:hypothetical protein n=1 Tax=Acinetobacter baumannii TaxID=470 RepID=UPI0002D0F1A0|nr:hypothetical protein [Acinetobacter baumannii]EIB6900973.1 hypothetical protein [Acinetobacter baumannii]ENU13846.1 hypothetical protein F996_01097 [Acinetobacter baumannii NIPH 24]EPG40002.1 hypothetical protein F910_01146 [Acinetobacter baumannii NIPH 410]MCT9273115.1 hypothetical protein [Acinetobacter baumannii]MCZ0697741.1 hypothetical protein [Acinetobacter baumannii]